MTEGTPVMLSTGQAAKQVGVSSRTVRRWIEKGYLPAEQTARGWLVSPGDLSAAQEAARLAEEGGRIPGARPDDPSDTRGATRISANDYADGPSDREPWPAGHPSPIVSDAARSQLEAIRDEWLAPLIAQLREVERENGKLQAERDALHERLRHYETEPPRPDPASPSTLQSRPWWQFWKGLFSSD